LLYQTLVGAWPSELLSDKSEKHDWEVFSGRIEDYMLKAIREAKENTSWINQNKEYEDAVVSFVRALIMPDSKNRFLDDFLPFERRVARLGIWNSMSQTVLKLTCPGVPDIYQGSELWNFSLVDPDNRRPVDYVRREQNLKYLSEGCGAPDASFVEALLESPEDGRMKLYLTWKTLRLRQQQPSLFRNGEYLPLSVAGAKADHVVAFARKTEEATLLVVAPRLMAGLLDNADVSPIGPQIWADTNVTVPFCHCGKQYRNVLTGKLLNSEQEVKVSEFFAEFPVALCLLD
jgi:(1->4)-alpha-D-glucan 1-alpha-D-glucosylmutase